MAFSSLPSASVKALLQSMRPAPVLARSSPTIFAVIWLIAIISQLKLIFFVTAERFWNGIRFIVLWYGRDGHLVFHRRRFDHRLDRTGWDRFRLGSLGKTSLDGVYAVGDIVRGASLVVWAIRDGRDTAQAVLEYLNGARAVAAE